MASLGPVLGGDGRGDADQLNVTAAYGTEGFGPDHLDAFRVRLPKIRGGSGESVSAVARARLRSPVMARELVVATDGSALGNPGPGGWAWVTEEEQEAFAGARESTNNRMELRAVLEALSAISAERPVRVLTDSEYVVKIFTEWLPSWRLKGMRTSRGRPVENKDLIERVERLLDGREVNFEWVRGHAGHPLNERADALANAAARRAAERLLRESRAV